MVFPHMYFLCTQVFGPLPYTYIYFGQTHVFKHSPCIHKQVFHTHVYMCKDYRRVPFKTVWACHMSPSNTSSRSIGHSCMCEYVQREIPACGYVQKVCCIRVRHVLVYYFRQSVPLWWIAWYAQLLVNICTSAHGKDVFDTKHKQKHIPGTRRVSHLGAFAIASLVHSNMTPCMHTLARFSYCTRMKQNSSSYSGTYVYMCVCACVRACVCVYIYIYIYIHTHTRMHTHTHTRTHTHTHAHRHTQNKNKRSICSSG